MNEDKAQRQLDKALKRVEEQDAELKRLRDYISADNVKRIDEDLAAASALLGADDEMDSLRRERDEALEKLEHNRCNSGHTTLPLKLWTCPACHEIVEQERDAALKRAADLACLLRDARGCLGNREEATQNDYEYALRDKIDAALAGARPDWCEVCREPLGRGVCPACEAAAG